MRFENSNTERELNPILFGGGLLQINLQRVYGKTVVINDLAILLKSKNDA